MTDSPLQSQSEHRLGVTVMCGGCGGDTTPRHGNTIPHCAACERWDGDFERFQPVRVWPGLEPMEPGDPDLAGLHGYVVGRCSTGAYDVALALDGAVRLFALYDTEIEPVDAIF